jgi:hypothetical protein
MKKIILCIIFLFLGCTLSLSKNDLLLIKDTQGSLASMLEGQDGGRVNVSTAQIKNAYCNVTIVLNDLEKNDSDAGIPCIVRIK